MSHKCPICSENFDSLELFDDHIEQHKEESILSKSPRIKPKNNENYTPSQSINLETIFDEEKFEKLIESKINSIKNTDELIHRRNFIEQVKKIYKKNPFCYIPYFLKDLIHGEAVGKIQDSFHFPNHIDLQIIIKDILNFKEERYRSAQYDDAFELNLNIIGWNEKHVILQNNFKYFENELAELFFENILQAYLVIILMDKYLDRQEIFEKCLEIKLNYSLFRFIDETLSIKFNQFLENNLKLRIDKILNELMSEKIVYFNRTETKKLKSNLNIDDVKNFTKKHLKFNDGTISMFSLNTLVNQNFPSLKLIPDLGIFDTAVDELEREKFIHKEYRSSKKNDYQIFLNDDFEKIEYDIKYLENTGEIPFKGRKITPETFISELIDLDKGDFNDSDDQVTRLAGLVLAESITLQPPAEKIEEFDFSMNLQNYRFRPEQLEAMAKLDFKINSEVFHVKVMVDEILTLSTYKKLVEKLSDGEQGVVITFKLLPLSVKKLIANDDTIQVIDEEGVKIWVSITSRLPARVNSICKIYSDKLSTLENKIVKVDSVFYEKGIAIVTVFPEMNEVTVLARSLEEIPLFEFNPSNFNLIAKNYFEFIKILTNCTMDDDLINGFFKNKFTEDPKYSKPVSELKFDYNTVHLNFKCHEKRDIFNCDCIKYAENPLQLCSHLVTAIDHIFRSHSYGDNFWNDSNRMKRGLENLLRENIEIILDRLDITEEHGAIKDEHEIMDFISGTIKTKNNS